MLERPSRLRKNVYCSLAKTSRENDLFRQGFADKLYELNETLRILAIKVNKVRFVGFEQQFAKDNHADIN